MPRPVVFFTHAHPVEGSVTLSRSGDTVELRVHWPLDRATDEWFDFTARCGVADFERGLASGGARLAGDPRGWSEVRSDAATARVVLDLATNDGFPRDELRLIVPGELPPG